MALATGLPAFTGKQSGLPKNTAYGTSPITPQQALDMYVGKPANPDWQSPAYQQANANPTTANQAINAYVSGAPFSSQVAKTTAQNSAYGTSTTGTSQQNLDWMMTLANQLASGDRIGIQRSLDTLQAKQTRQDSYYDWSQGNNQYINDLKKQGIDLGIYNAQRQMGIAGSHYQDYVNTQTALTNAQIGDLNIQAAGQQRNIAYGNQLLQLAAQALGLDRDQYVNIQNLLNSRQQNLNTVTNLGSESNTTQFGAQKRNTYNDVVSSGALSSTGGQQNLQDVDTNYKIAQDKLREDLRQGTAEIGSQRTTAGIDYSKSENAYQERSAGIRNQQAQQADNIKLLESQGSQIRSTYGFNVREAGRDYQTTMGNLGTQIGQWGIDKQLLDAQLQDSFKQLGIQQQMNYLDYLDKAGGLNDSLKAVYSQSILQAMQYLPLVQQNPWLMQVFGNMLSGSSPSTTNTSMYRRQ